MAAICAGVLPWPKMTSGKPLPRGPVMVDPGEPQVLERLGAKQGDRGRRGPPRPGPRPAAGARAGRGVRSDSWPRSAGLSDEPCDRYNERLCHAAQLHAGTALMTLLETLILGSYFFVLVILAVYGWHRYYLVYAVHEEQGPGAGPAASLGRPAAAGHDPAADLQRDVRGRPAARGGLRESTIRGAARNPGARRLDRRDHGRWRELAVRPSARPRGSTSSTCTGPIGPGYKAGRARGGPQGGPRRVRRDLRRRLHPDARTSSRRRVPHFADPKVALVQARWGHINAGLLAADQGPVHPARRRTSCSSTAAATARAASSTSTARPASGGARRSPTPGGWQHDTLTEDLDLSYRAQLRGWQFVFLPDLVAPAEVPVEMNAFKSQQHRWAKGSIQICRKLLPRILQSDLPFGVKAEAFFHLTANFNYLLMSLLSVLMFPSMVIRYNMGWYEMLLIDVPLFFAATASVANFYIVSQRELYPDWKTRLKLRPVPDVDRHRPGREQHARRARGALAPETASSRARRSTASSAAPTSGWARSTSRRWPSSRSSSWRSGSTSP